MFFKFVEAVTKFFDVFFIVILVIDYLMSPARSNAMSVEGLIGSQYFDFPAAVENLGSTVIIVTPLSIASDISWI